MATFALIVIFQKKKKYYTRTILLITEHFVPTFVPALKPSRRQHRSVTRTHCLTYTQI